MDLIVLLILAGIAIPIGAAVHLFGLLSPVGFIALVYSFWYLRRRDDGYASWLVRSFGGHGGLAVFLWLVVAVAYLLGRS